MRSKKLVLTVVMAAMLAMTGCGSKKEPVEIEKTETVTMEDSIKEESTQAETKEESKQETEASTEEAETVGDEKAEANTEFTDLNKLLGKAVNSDDDEEIEDIFEDASEDTGYLGDNADTITNAFELLDVKVEDLDQFNMDLYEGENVLFYFTMYNDEELQTVDTGDEESFLTQYRNDNDEEIYVLFGSDEATSFDEAEVYCEEGTTMEYWAVGCKQNGIYMVAPIVAGNEEAGYYLVLPVLDSVGVEMPDTMSLTEQEISFKTDNEKADSEKKNNTSTATKAELTGDEYIYFEITGMEGDKESLMVNYELTNYYPMDVYISGAEIILNGEDITDAAAAFFEVDANDTIQDCFFIDGYELKAGDELVIKGMLTDHESMDEIGEIEFPIILKNK